MNDCRTCGRKIRYRVMRISFNRRQGASGWLETEDSPQCPCLKDYAAIKMKADKKRPTDIDRMIQKWNTENPA